MFSLRIIGRPSKGGVEDSARHTNNNIAVGVDGDEKLSVAGILVAETITQWLSWDACWSKR